jgi:hypothetical protein
MRSSSWASWCPYPMRAAASKDWSGEGIGVRTPA